MTRNQMHNTLRYVREQLADERGSDFSGVKALDMVLEELGQEPSGDLISRQAVKDWFCTNYCSEHNKCEHFENGDCNAMIELFAISSVNPQEPKAGHWIESNIPNEKYVCSECGGACWYYDYQGDVAKSRYCPNCGAKMESEDKG